MEKMTDAEKLKLLIDYQVNIDLICALSRTYLDEKSVYDAYTSYASYEASRITKDEFSAVIEILRG